MSSPLSCILPIDKGIIFFAILIAMCDRELDIFSYEMYDRIAQLLRLRLILKEIEQPIPTIECLIIEMDFETSIQIGVIPELIFDILRSKFVVLEYFNIRIERHNRSIGLSCLADLMVFDEDAMLKLCNLRLAVSYGLNYEMA